MTRPGRESRPTAAAAGANQPRWQHLAQAAFLLEEHAAKPDRSAQGMLAPIESALELFTAGIDPVEDFEGYAVRRMLLAVRECFAAREES